MKLELTKEEIFNIKCDILIVNLFSDKYLNEIDRLTDDFWNNIKIFIYKNTQIGELGKTTEIFTFDKIKAVKILFVGLGKFNEFTNYKLQKATSTALRYAVKNRAKTVAILINKECQKNYSIEFFLQAIISGAYIGQYFYQQFKTEKENKVQKLLIILDSDKNNKSIDNIIQKYCIEAKALSFARNLTNMPANYLDIQRFVEIAQKESIKNGLDIDVFDNKGLEKMNAGGILAVGKGSKHDPCMVVAIYKGDPKNKTDLLALVGKGVIFDSGGLCIKGSHFMRQMHMDMVGAAICLAAINAVAKMKLNINVVAIMPLVENMPGGYSYKVGDILTAMNGKTIEVVNTDAEGRIILADGLCYAKDLGANVIIDIASLTGAVITALGKNVAGLMSNNEDLSNKLFAVGNECNERLWKLPMYEDYNETLKSHVADIKNISMDLGAGTITAAKFLENFVGNTSWAHIDIAGTNNIETPKSWIDAGATGFGTRILINFMIQQSNN